MSNDELIDAGFNIDPDYVPVISISWLVDNMTETVEGYYTRCVEMVENLIKSTVPEGNDVEKCSYLDLNHYQCSHLHVFW